MIWVHITAGRGPLECAWVVGRFCQYLEKQWLKNNISYFQIHSEEGKAKDCYHSALYRVDCQTAQQAGIESGTIKWVGKSPFRRYHKRKNWFIGAEILSPPQTTEVELGKLEIKRHRSSGPGGQNVNKVETAVKIHHLTTGIRVQASEERSQKENLSLAMARLHYRLENLAQQEKAESQKSLWEGHNNLERGNPVLVFRGNGFS